MKHIMMRERIESARRVNPREAHFRGLDPTSRGTLEEALEQSSRMASFCAPLPLPFP